MAPISLAVLPDVPLGSCWVAISPIGSGSQWSATRGGLCGGRVGLAISPIGSGGLGVIWWALLGLPWSVMGWVIGL
uniref:Uncharacterized protein n=1 Tax=Fagus sylvatica TaxID=28930 RepID=A0A2N9GLZ8_FAGSY